MFLTEMPGKLTTTQTFGALLKQFRTRAALSQEVLAERAELSVEAISALERGVRRNPYRETVLLLTSALGLSPAEHELLAESARRPATPRAPAAIRSSLQPVNGPNGNVPVQLTSFVGQSNELTNIHAKLQAHRLVTLIGAGGVGKTRVALEVAATAAPGMPDGAWLVEFAALTDSTLVAGAIAATLKLRMAAGCDPLEDLLAALSGKALLLVLDNCEHVIETVRLVAARLLAQCPGIRLIATSRQPLRIAGEATSRIPSLAAADAVKLFYDRAQAVEPAFEFNDATASIVADICRRLDGIPLAVELAASRAASLSVSDLRDRLDQRFRLLTSGRPEALPRQQTLRALIDWSYDLLDECEQRFFRRVAVFADSFTLEAASAICGDDDGDELDVLDLIASLVDRSLIMAVVAGDVTRYRFLESMRLYAAEILNVDGERAWLEARHLAFFSETAAAAEDLFQQTGSDAAFSSLAPDLEDIRAALRCAVSAGKRESAALAHSASRLFQRLGYGGEGIAWLEAALRVVDPSDTRLQSRLWNSISYVHGNSGGARSLEASERAVALARSTGDCDLTAWSLTQCAVALMDQKRRDDAEAALAEAEHLFGVPPKPLQRARILAVRLHIVRLTGDMRSAIEMSKELASLYCRLGNESGELRTTLNYAECLHAGGETATAIAVAREALMRDVDDRETLGIIQLNLTAYLAAAGKAAESLASGARAIEFLETAGRGTGAVATAIGHLALAHALNGESARAATLLGYWDATTRALGLTAEFTERLTHERLTAALENSLQPAPRAALFAVGAALEPQAAIFEALR